MDFTFTATNETRVTASVPLFEDASADYAPYYKSRMTIREAMAAVREEFIKLNASVLSFREGHFGTGRQRRYGYEIPFLLHGREGVVRVAGLPMRSETRLKIERVKVQALLNVRDWLKAAVTQPVFQPGAGHPLMMHLLVDGKRTMAEAIMESGRLPGMPALGAGEEEIVQGDFREIR